MGQHLLACRLPLGVFHPAFQAQANLLSQLLRRVQIEAGKGMAGANGVLEEFAYKSQEELNGNDAKGTAGGDPKICDCSGGSQTSGGVGGTGLSAL